MNGFGKYKKDDSVFFVLGNCSNLEILLFYNRNWNNVYTMEFWASSPAHFNSQYYKKKSNLIYNQEWIFIVIYIYF